MSTVASEQTRHSGLNETNLTENPFQISVAIRIFTLGLNSTVTGSTFAFTARSETDFCWNQIKPRANLPCPDGWNNKPLRAGRWHVYTTPVNQNKTTERRNDSIIWLQCGVLRGKLWFWHPCGFYINFLYTPSAFSPHCNRAP